VQVEAIRKGFAGPKTRAGVPVYPGFFYDTGITASGRGIPGLLVTGFSPVGPSPTVQVARGRTPWSRSRRRSRSLARTSVFVRPVTFRRTRLPPL